MADIQQTLSKHEARLMALPGVVGVGEGEDAGRPVIVVLARSGRAALQARLPASLDGFAVQVQLAGEITAF